MKSSETECNHEIISVFKQRKGREPDTNSREWLDWCYVWNRASNNMPDPIKKRIDANQFDYDDFVAIWKITKKRRDHAG
jgi:hypothetical protein